MGRGLLIVGLCGFLAAGCGDDEGDGTGLSGDPLTCDWLASNNCWKTTVAAAQSCVPPASETGVLNADGTSCAYASGSSVAFHEPVIVPSDIDDPLNWDFTQSQAGVDCVSLEDYEDGSSLTLTVQGMTYREKYEGFGMQVTCPDGSKFATDDVFDLLECDNFFQDGPGWASGSSDVSVSLTLSNGADGVQVFSCSR